MAAVLPRALRCFTGSTGSPRKKHARQPGPPAWHAQSPIAYEAGMTATRHMAQGPLPAGRATLLDYGRNLSASRAL